MTYTADQLELLELLEAGKAKAQAWVAEDPENRFAGYATVDLDHWAEMGVYSVADYERHDLETLVWDMYKDVHGVRPRGLGINEMSNDELKGMVDDLQAVLEIQIEDEKAAEARAIEKFEARVAEVISLGAGDRETAIRWIREATEDEDEIRRDGYFEHCNGLPYGYLAKEAV